VSQVVLKVNGRSYRIACDDGEEPRVKALGRYVDTQVADLVSKVGQVGELQLLLMAALMIADELQEVRGDQETAAAQGQAVAAEALEHCASRLESIATRLEGA